ncbi:hypothetical protein ACJMK2_003365 [Sinanodonta woodiana]|uniref:Uncharacterized protein n=1 Tax=Sinanodonta woodiana TaxID=1069815 RepID=A0ABD3XYS1_SINWO
MSMLGKAAMSCASASVTLNIVAIALPFWYYYDSPHGFGTTYFGLWMTCSKYASVSTECNSFTIVPSYFDTVRALEILGLLLVAGAGVLGFLKMYAIKDNSIIPLVAGGLAFVAGLFMIIGAIVFSNNTITSAETGATLHAGFALAIVSGVVAFAATGLFVASNFIKVSP